MPNLSAYLDFNVRMDFNQNKIFIIDTSSYPTGVAENIQGIVTVEQPDSITVEGDFDDPNITYESGELTEGEVELRLDYEGLPQKGTYTITYTADHPDYSPTSKTKTFEFTYTPVEVSISETFDVFTPNLKLNDDTDYDVDGFDRTSTSRLWNVTVGNVTTIAGTSSIVDLVYNSNYYDAEYSANLTTNLTYQHQVYDYLTVVDEQDADYETTANTPPDFPTLQSYLKEIKAVFDALNSVEQTTSRRQSYEYAESILQHIKNRICAGDTVGLYSQVQDFLNVYYDYTSSLYVNTNEPIPTYDYESCDCGDNSGNVPPAVIAITQTDINSWNEAFGAIPPADLWYIVGVTAGAPGNGESTFQKSDFVNWTINLSINKIEQSPIEWDGQYYDKPSESDTLTLHNMAFVTGDLIHIQFRRHTGTEQVNGVTTAGTLTTDFEATGGELTKTITALIDKTIITYFRDGIQKKVITSGTPTDKQVKFNSVNGEFTYPYAQDLDEYNLIVYK
jgi:hypothetical protein